MYVRVKVSFAQSLPQTLESGQPESYGPKTSGELMPFAPLVPFVPLVPLVPFVPGSPFGPTVSGASIVRVLPVG